MPDQNPTHNNAVAGITDNDLDAELEATLSDGIADVEHDELSDLEAALSSADREIANARFNLERKIMNTPAPQTPATTDQTPRMYSGNDASTATQLADEILANRQKPTNRLAVIMQQLEEEIRHEEDAARTLIAARAVDLRQAEEKFNAARDTLQAQVDFHLKEASALRDKLSQAENVFTTVVKDIGNKYDNEINAMNAILSGLKSHRDVTRTKVDAINGRPETLIVPEGQTATAGTTPTSTQTASSDQNPAPNTTGQ